MLAGSEIVSAGFNVANRLCFFQNAPSLAVQKLTIHFGVFLHPLSTPTQVSCPPLAPVGVFVQRSICLVEIVYFFKDKTLKRKMFYSPVKSKDS